MKKKIIVIKKSLFGLCILFFNHNNAAFSDGKSYFYNRSHVDFAINDICFQNKIDVEESYKKDFKVNEVGNFTNIFKKNRLIIDNKVVYKKSFDSSGLGKYFFGKNKIVFTGSRVKNRGETDILADYFGLPSDFHSIVTYKPVVDTFSYELSSSVNLDFLCKDVYAKISVPYVYTKWNLNIKEKLLNKGSQPYPAGYMSAGNRALPRSQLVKNVKEYFQGNVFFGDMQEHLAYGKIDGAKDAIGVADIHILFAGRVIKKENSYCDLLLKIIAPTGRSSSAEYLFEPCLGNGNHWQIGVGFSGKNVIKEDGEKDTKWEFSYSGLISHLFTSKQRRSFDLKNNDSGSRYMLLEEFDDPLDTPFTIFLEAPDSQSSQYQYKGQLFPAINKTTFDCHIAVPVEANFLVQFSYYKNNWNINSGYNLWVRSGEKINKRGKLTPNIFGVKGDSQVYGIVNPGGGVEISLPLAATQSKATLCRGQGNENIHSPLLATDFRNQNIDNPALAVGRFAPPNPATLLNQFSAVDAANLGLALAQVNSSSPSILLKDINIDEKSGLSSAALSNRLFVDFIFEKKYKNYNSYVGFGVDVEFASSLEGKKSVLSQWGLWFKYSLLC